MLAEMEDTRRHLDADIADIRRILARHGSGGTSVSRRSGGASASSRGETRSAILDVMRADPRRWRTGEVAKHLGKSKGSVSTAMIRMARAGILANPEYGLYEIPGHETPPAPDGAPEAPGATHSLLHEGGHGEESS
jgi:hypothetical protein